MDIKRVTEWLATAEGLAKAAVAFLGVPALIWAAATKVLDPLVLPRWASAAGAALVIAALSWLLWRSFRRFVVASRLEQPDAFTLHPTGPSSLIGRSDDMAKLLKSVKHNRLVLLDGESGCGKTALVVAGLIPQLSQHPDGLLPVAICDWGEDWVRGPLSAALEALFNCLSPADREKLGWLTSPDLAADTLELASDLDRRLKAVFDTLGRRPLVIADQFDDHQAQHRDRFLDSEANWLAPTALAGANPFWRVISQGLSERRLHLLVVTRADTAAGLACVRFLGEDQTVARTLPRVETEYLRPLLANIAPDDAQPAVVSNPAGGWHELRERLESDLKAEGAVLMQQVRCVLLGLRQLPLLTPGRYRAAGGLRGVETLVISRALRRAGNAAGGGDAGSRIARAVLRELILPGGPNQPPKAQRASVVTLTNVTGHRPHTEAILDVLQKEEVVRPADAVGETGAWQLDHDYLARAVLAEAQRSDRWSMLLREGQARYAEAAGDWKRQWAALLPLRTLVRVCWERARRRLQFGEAATYAWVSALRPAGLVLGFVLVGAALNIGYERLLIWGRATNIVRDFDTRFETRAVLDVWRLPEPVRQRVYLMLLPDVATLSPTQAEGPELESALLSYWPLAHAGLEPVRAREMAAVLRTQLQREREPNPANRLVQIYSLIAPRLGSADVKAEATVLSARLVLEQNDVIASSLGQAYAAVARRLTDPVEARGAATILRSRMVQKQDVVIDHHTLSAYEAVAAHLDATDAKAEASALRAQFEQERDNGDVRGGLAFAYAAVATQLKDPTDVRDAAAFFRTHLTQALDFYSQEAYSTVIARLGEADAKAEAVLLRTRLKPTLDDKTLCSLAEAHAILAARLHDAADVKVAALLRARLGRASTAKSRPALLSKSDDYTMPYDIGHAYTKVAAHLSQADLKTEAPLLRALLAQQRDSEDADSLVEAYAAVAERLSDAADVKEMTPFLLALLGRTRNKFTADRLARAYAIVAARLDDANAQADAGVLRSRLEQDRDDGVTGSLVQAYASAAARFSSPADVKAAAAFLRDRLDQALKASIAPTTASTSRSGMESLGGRHFSNSFVHAYMTVAARLNETDAQAEAQALRSRFDEEQDGRIVGDLAEAYAAVAIRLAEPADLKAAAARLRTRLERESYRADQLARAYAQVAAVLVARAETPERPALVREILMLAGHPYVQIPDPLLALLKPWAKQDFGIDVVAAVTWAVSTHGIQPSQLRPSSR